MLSTYAFIFKMLTPYLDYNSWKLILIAQYIGLNIYLTVATDLHSVNTWQSFKSSPLFFIAIKKMAQHSIGYQTFSFKTEEAVDQKFISHACYFKFDSKKQFKQEKTSLWILNISISQHYQSMPICLKQIPQAKI